MDAPAPATPRISLSTAIAAAVGAIAASAALGLAGAEIARRLWLQPRFDVFERRYQTSEDVIALYELQLAHKSAKGVYADDLDSLLALARDGAAWKAGMAKRLDLNTLTIVGGAEKFKIEANVLDDERTLVKIKGPIRDAAPRPSAPAAETGAAGVDEGAPIPPAR